MSLPNSIEGHEFRYYGFYVNLDERGEFYADVRDHNMKTVYEVYETEIFEDGFMRGKDDLRGLTEHLVSLGIIHEDAEIVSMQEFEAMIYA